MEQPSSDRTKGKPLIMANKKNLTATKAGKTTTGKATKANATTAAAEEAGLKAAAPERERASKSRELKPKAEGRPASTTLEIHINKTGRVCFGKNAAARIGDLAHMLMTADGKQVRMVAKEEATENTVEIRRANG